MSAGSSSFQNRTFSQNNVLSPAFPGRSGPTPYGVYFQNKTAQQAGLSQVPGQAGIYTDSSGALYTDIENVRQQNKTIIVTTPVATEATVERKQTQTPLLGGAFPAIYGEYPYGARVYEKVSTNTQYVLPDASNPGYFGTPKEKRQQGEELQNANRFKQSFSDASAEASSYYGDFRGAVAPYVKQVGQFSATRTENFLNVVSPPENSTGFGSRFARYELAPVRGVLRFQKALVNDPERFVDAVVYSAAFGGGLRLLSYGVMATPAAPYITQAVTQFPKTVKLAGALTFTGLYGIPKTGEYLLAPTREKKDVVLSTIPFEIAGFELGSKAVDVGFKQGDKFLVALKETLNAQEPTPGVGKKTTSTQTTLNAEQSYLIQTRTEGFPGFVESEVVKDTKYYPGSKITDSEIRSLFYEKSGGTIEFGKQKLGIEGYKETILDTPQQIRKIAEVGLFTRTGEINLNPGKKIIERPGYFEFVEDIKEPEGVLKDLTSRPAQQKLLSDFTQREPFIQQATTTINNEKIVVSFDAVEKTVTYNPSSAARSFTSSLRLFTEKGQRMTAKPSTTTQNVLFIDYTKQKGYIPFNELSASLKLNLLSEKTPRFTFKELMSIFKTQEKAKTINPNWRADAFKAFDTLEATKKQSSNLEKGPQETIFKTEATQQQKIDPLFIDPETFTEFAYRQIFTPEKIPIMQEPTGTKPRTYSRETRTPSKSSNLRKPENFIYGVARGTNYNIKNTVRPRTSILENNKIIEEFRLGDKQAKKSKQTDVIIPIEKTAQRTTQKTSTINFIPGPVIPEKVTTPFEKIPDVPIPKIPELYIPVPYLAGPTPPSPKQRRQQKRTEEKYGYNPSLVGISLKRKATKKFKKGPFTGLEIRGI